MRRLRKRSGPFNEQARNADPALIYLTCQLIGKMAVRMTLELTLSCDSDKGAIILSYSD
jgi:hypothetical protein